jgi:hypothetical protein
LTESNELSAILDNSQHHFNYAFADAALYTIASSKDQKFFKMSLFNSKFEIATENWFWAHIDHWLSKYNICVTLCVTPRVMSKCPLIGSDLILLFKA